MPEPKPEIKTYLKIYFNNNANPWGDFDPQTEKTVPLEEVVGDPADLHENMRSDKTVGGYETFEIRSVTIDGQKYETEEINHSVKTYFGTIRSVRDLKIYNGHTKGGQEVLIPFLDIYPDTDPDTVLFTADGGGISLHLEQNSNIRVIDRKTNQQVWPAAKPS